MTQRISNQVKHMLTVDPHNPTPKKNEDVSTQGLSVKVRSSFVIIRI